MDTSDTFGLQGLGLAVEMGDAVLGMVVKQMGAKRAEMGRGAATRLIRRSTRRD